MTSKKLTVQKSTNLPGKFFIGDVSNKRLRVNGEITKAAANGYIEIRYFDSEFEAMLCLAGMDDDE